MPLDLLAHALGPVAPRYYSVASAPPADGSPPPFVRICFSVVGLCSSFLRRAAIVACQALQAATTATTPQRVALPALDVFFRAAPLFRAPPASAPLLMIGAGTGVAPFLAFLEARLLAGAEAAAPAWLYAGHRHAAEDHLYADELAQFGEAGVLHRYRVAFSRDPPAATPAMAAAAATATMSARKLYAQDLLLQDAALIAPFIAQPDAVIALCGDAKGIVQGVRAALAEILVAHGLAADEADAKRVLLAWTKARKLLTDVWG